MSPGAVIYHYRTTEDLLLAVHEDAQRRFLDLRAEAGRAGSGDAWARLVAGFKAGLPPFAEGDLIELLYEMHGMTRRSPRHAVLLTQLWEAELALYEELVAAGVDEGIFRVDDATVAARGLLALEDGLALHVVSRNESMTSSVALGTFVSVAATLLGNPALADRERTR
jgi:AcrR family transcriptional regulator